MRSKNLFLIIMLFLAFSTVNAQEYGQQNSGDSLIIKADIKKAIDLLKEKNKNIRISKENLTQKKYAEKAALSYLLPKIELEGRFIHNPEYVFELNKVRDAIISTTNSSAQISQGILKVADGQRAIINAVHPTTAAQVAQLDGASKQLHAGLATLSDPTALTQKMGDWNTVLRNENIGNLNLKAEWVIYAGGRISAAREAARLRTKEANQDLNTTINQQISDLISKYYGSRLTNEVVKIRKQVVEGMKQHFEDAQKLEKNGQISKTETLYAKMSYYEALHEYTKAKNSAKLIQIVLNDCLDETNDVEAVSPLFLSKKIKPFSYYRDLLLETNPILKSLKTKEKLVEQGIKKQRGEFLPSIALVGSKTLSDYNQSQLTPNWYVGAGLKLNLFKGTKDYNDLKIAKLKKTQVRIYQDKAESDLTTYLYKTYQELENSIEEYQAKEKALDFAKEYLTAKEKAFKEGFAKSTDVVDARMNLSKSMIQQLQTLYKFDVALAKLLEISGVSEEFGSYQSEDASLIYENSILN